MRKYVYLYTFTCGLHFYRADAFTNCPSTSRQLSDETPEALLSYICKGKSVINVSKGTSMSEICTRGIPLGK